MIVTWDNIKELNEETEKLGYKIHLSDACSGQCMWIEDLKHEEFSGNEKLRAVIRDYFKQEKSEIVFCKDGKSFWTKN